MEGQPRIQNAIIRVPSKEAALGLYNGADYQEAKRLRQASASSCTMRPVEQAASQGTYSSAFAGF
jgi:uncharacterized protein (DUF1330 family)